MLARLTRVNFFSGQLLTAEDLQLEQAYFIQRSQRHNRTLHGSGIVEGLAVAVKRGDVYVEPGLALDCAGNEIVLDTPQTLALPATASRTIYLVVRYSEKQISAVPALSDGASDLQASRVEESFILDYAAVDPLAKHARRASLRCACGAAHGVTLAKLVRGASAGRWRLA